MKDMPTSQRWKAFTLLVVSYFITIVDFTIVNVALPAIGRELRFPESDLQWVVTAYGLTFAGFVLLGGHVGHLPHGDARDPGARGGARAPRGLVDRDEPVRRGSRAQQGPRHLGRGGRPGRDRRPAGRRNPHDLRRMAVHLLLQRPHRRDGTRPRAQDGAREPRPQRTATLRHRRRRVDHGRPADARLRHLPGTRGWLGGYPDCRPACRRGGPARAVPRRRNEGRGALAAAFAAPPGRCRRVERGRLPARSELLPPSCSLARSTCSRCSVSLPS